MFGGDGGFSHFSLLRLLSHEDGDIDEEQLVRCSSNPQTQNQVHCKFELNRLPSTAATGSKSLSAHTTHQRLQTLTLTEHHRSPNLDSLNLDAKKKMLANPVEWKEPTEPRSEPAEPLDSPHESPISKRKFLFAKKAVHTNFRVDIREHAPIFFAPCPGPLRKLQFSFCKASLLLTACGMSNGSRSVIDLRIWDNYHYK